MRETCEGHVDLTHLEELLRQTGNETKKIGCFTAASNITGTINCVDDITILLHRYGALALWDYATAGN